MQITANTTGMQSGLTLTADVEARDHCVVVVKGTFIADEQGELRLADEQQPIVCSDEHYGDPKSSPVRLESEFVLEKPWTDVVVVGKAVAPGGVSVERLSVHLELPGHSKEVLVVGDRRWVRSLGEVFPSAPVPFVEMPLTFDRSFGGVDESAGPSEVESELRNLVGVGFHPRRTARAIEGLPVPNLEHPKRTVRSPRERVPPVGFGVVGRTWLPRRSYAGTYDAAWLKQRAPYLPADFDPRFNQCAPEDQQLPLLQGGEVIRCVHMSERPIVTYVLPDPLVPVRFRFVAADMHRSARLDTVILEPHLSRAQLIWRCSAPVGKRPTDLREIMIGEQPAEPASEAHGNKPRFRSLDDAIRSIRSRKESGA